MTHGDGGGETDLAVEYQLMRIISNGILEVLFAMLLDGKDAAVHPCAVAAACFVYSCNPSSCFSELVADLQRCTVGCIRRA